MGSQDCCEMSLEMYSLKSHDKRFLKKFWRKCTIIGSWKNNTSINSKFVLEKILIKHPRLVILEKNIKLIFTIIDLLVLDIILLRYQVYF